MKNKFNELYHSLISESPMLADREYRSDLNQEGLNKKETQKVIEVSSKKEHYKDLEVWEYFQHSSDKFWNYFIKNGQIEAVVVFQIKNNNFRCWGVWQKRQNKGLVRDLFLNYFAKKDFDSIISDPVANDLGKTFWKKLLDEFAERGQKITILKRDKQEESYDSATFEKHWKNNKSSAFDVILASDIQFKIHLK